MKGSTFGINAEIAAASRASLSSAPQVTDEAVEAACCEAHGDRWELHAAFYKRREREIMRRVLEQFAPSAPAVSGEPVGWQPRRSDGVRAILKPDASEYVSTILPTQHEALNYSENTSGCRPLYAAPATIEAVLKAAEMILSRSPDITTNDSGRGPTTTTRNALAAVRAALYAAPSAPVEDAVKAEREALRACVPILEGLIAAEYNVETWGVKGRLAAVLAALDRARKP